MKINEVEKITGLTKKAIRLYEIRGLIKVNRSTNGYRDYSEEDIAVLKQITRQRVSTFGLSPYKTSC